MVISVIGYWCRGFGPILPVVCNYPKEMELGFNLKEFISGQKKEKAVDNGADIKDEKPETFTGDLLGGKKKSILEVAGTIRTGVRIGNITRQTAAAANSKKYSSFISSKSGDTRGKMGNS